MTGNHNLRVFSAEVIQIYLYYIISNHCGGLEPAVDKTLTPKPGKARSIARRREEIDIQMDSTFGSRRGYPRIQVPSLPIPAWDDICTAGIHDKRDFCILASRRCWDVASNQPHLDICEGPQLAMVQGTAKEHTQYQIRPWHFHNGDSSSTWLPRSRSRLDLEYPPSPRFLSSSYITQYPSHTMRRQYTYDQFPPNSLSMSQSS